MGKASKTTNPVESSPARKSWRQEVKQKKRNSKKNQSVSGSALPMDDFGDDVINDSQDNEGLSDYGDLDENTTEQEEENLPLEGILEDETDQRKDVCGQPGRAGNEDACRAGNEDAGSAGTEDAGSAGNEDAARAGTEDAARADTEGEVHDQGSQSPTAAQDERQPEAQGFEDEWEIVLDLEKLSVASLATVFQYSKSSVCRGQGILESRESLTWQDGEPGYDTICFIKASSKVPEDRIVSVAAMCNLFAKKLYKAEMTTHDMYQKLSLVFDKDLKHQQSYNIAGKPATMFKKSDMERGWTMLEEKSWQTWTKANPCRSLSLVPRKERKDAKRAGKKSGKKSQDVEQDPVSRENVNQSRSNKPSAFIEQCINDGKRLASAGERPVMQSNETAQDTNDVLPHVAEVPGISTDCCQDLRMELSKACKEIHTLKDSILRQQCNNMKSLKSSIHNMHQTLVKAAVEQKEAQRLALIKFEELLETHTESIDALAHLVKQHLGTGSGSGTPAPFVVSVSQAMQERARAIEQKPANEKKNKMLEAFGITDEDLLQNYSYAFPAQNKRELIRILSTPSIKKEFIRGLDFSGYTCSRALTATMTRLVGSHTALSKQLYLLP